jgi:1,4-dihydroxy-2-naphthoate octaprenyltransferase
MVVSSGRAWIRLARPSMLPLLLFSLVGGWGFGHWQDARPLTAAPQMALLAAAWICLHAGTLWLNAARDLDTGPVLFGAPTPVPPATRRLGALALGLSLLLSAPTGAIPAICALLCVGLAWRYSAPSQPWKADPILGPLVNILGYGLLTPLAGLGLVGDPSDPRAILAIAIGVFVIAGLTFAAQVFQAEEDRSRGDRTLVATHGPRVTLQVASWLLAIALGLCLFGLIAGFFPRTAAILLAPAFAMARHLHRWNRQPDPGDPTLGSDHARHLVRHLVRVVAMGMIGAFAQYVADSFEGGPVAGRATAFQPERPQESSE